MIESLKSVFTDWVCLFPGKMGISWKLAHNRVGTREEMEVLANKNCNVVAVPLGLWERYKEYETESVRLKTGEAWVKERLIRIYVECIRGLADAVIIADQEFTADHCVAVVTQLADKAKELEKENSELSMTITKMVLENPKTTQPLKMAQLQQEIAELKKG